MARAATVEAYVETHPLWSSELQRLRELLLGCGLEATMKWGAPCFVHAGENVVALVGFKSYFGLWFFQGALLADPAGVLINAQSGRTRAQRQWRMQCPADIDEERIRAYVLEAVEVATAGAGITPRRAPALEPPIELAERLRSDATLARAFAALTEGRRREYAEHVRSAKRADTRRRRVDRMVPLILAGQGLNDRYRGI